MLTPREVSYIFVESYPHSLLFSSTNRVTLFSNTNPCLCSTKADSSLRPRAIGQAALGTPAYGHHWQYLGKGYYCWVYAPANHHQHESHAIEAWECKARFYHFDLRQSTTVILPTWPALTLCGLWG